MVYIEARKKIILIFVLVSIFIQTVCIFCVSAANIGVSPASLNFKQVLRGGYSEKSIVISTDSLKAVTVEIKPRGEITSWLNFSVMNFTVSRDKLYSLKISVTPPADMPNGNYTGFLRLMTSGFGEGIEGHAVGIVKSTLDLAINVEVTDIEIVECSASNFKVQSVEKGDDIVFNLDVFNNGNIRLKPRIKIELWDKDQISIVKSQEFLEKEILPTTQKSLTIKFKSSNLEIGQYWSDVSVIDCYALQTLTFDILEEGALKAEGVLLGIVVRGIAEVDETVPIKIRFKNTGEKGVEAYFKGKITLGEKIVQLLETEKISVPISEIQEFSLFFTPKKSGKYIISGRVFYANKKTFESSATLEAISKKLNLSSFIVPLVYIILILLIAFLFYKIRKEKKSYLSKLKKLKK